MLLIVCVSNPVDTVGIAELTGIDVTGASVESSCFSSSDKRMNLRCECNHKVINKEESQSSDQLIIIHDLTRVCLKACLVVTDISGT